MTTQFEGFFVCVSIVVQPRIYIVVFDYHQFTMMDIIKNAIQHP